MGKSKPLLPLLLPLLVLSVPHLRASIPEGIQLALTTNATPGNVSFPQWPVNTQDMLPLLTACGRETISPKQHGWAV